MERISKRGEVLVRSRRADNTSSDMGFFGLKHDNN
jgi:hypothetical protein